MDSPIPKPCTWASLKNWSRFLKGPPSPDIKRRGGSTLSVCPAFSDMAAALRLQGVCFSSLTWTKLALQSRLLLLPVENCYFCAFLDRFFIQNTRNLETTPKKILAPQNSVRVPPQTRVLRASLLGARWGDSLITSVWTCIVNGGRWPLPASSCRHTCHCCLKHGTRTAKLPLVSHSGAAGERTLPSSSAV